ncbi:MAG: hypothetical protein ACLPT4_13670 [Verrucomicrobiia bacterium]
MNEGKDILNLVRNMQKLNAEIAALIKTYEKLLVARGFQSDGGNSITNDLSTSLQEPQRWTPLWMYRILKNKADGDDVLILNIVLDSPDAPDEVQEPLVLCARFFYRKGQASNWVGEWDPWDLWFGKAADKTGELYGKSDLKLESEKFCTYADWSKECIQTMKDIRFLAVPLARLVDRKALEEQIILRIL